MVKLLKECVKSNLIAPYFHFSKVKMAFLSVASNLKLF